MRHYVCILYRSLSVVGPPPSENRCTAFDDLIATHHTTVASHERGQCGSLPLFVVRDGASHKRSQGGSLPLFVVRNVELLHEFISDTVHMGKQQRGREEKKQKKGIDSTMSGEHKATNSQLGTCTFPSA